MNSFDEVYETLPSNGWLSKDEAYLLWKWANVVSGAILEIGSYQGRSTVLLAAADRMVYAVDPFDGFCEEHSGDEICKCFRDNLSERKIYNVVSYRQKIEDWNIRPVGFAYLDGDHTPQGTRNQIEVAVKCGAEIIAIHDVNDSGDGKLIKEVALQMLGNWTERVERLAVWDRRP